MPANHELLFGSLTNLFILGWLLLAIAAFLKESNRVRGKLLLIGGRIIPIVLLTSFVIGWALTRGLPGEITSLDGVLTSYAVPEKVLIAWFEVLGLALLVARWTIEHAAARSVPRAILFIGLLGTFVAAAIGLLLYLSMSYIWGKANIQTATVE